VIGVTVLGFAACSEKPKEPPTKAAVHQLLQQEAESLKSEGEAVDPSLEVKITWEIQSVETREMAGDEARPWEGTIRFLISSEQEDYDGKTDTQTFEKEFDYDWDLRLERWLMK
jgi:hypothetical protein